MENQDRMDDNNSDLKRTTASDSGKPPKPKKQYTPRSPVWNHFTRSTEKKGFATCNYCGREFTCAQGTTSMANHTPKCNEYMASLDSEKQKTLVRGVGGKEGENSVVAKGFDKDSIRDATIKMIILDELAFSFVESPGFKLFCSGACPKFDIPSRKTVTRDMFKLFMNEKAILKSLLSEQRISFTTDIWTSITTVSYMVITAHYIDENWVLHKKIIGFRPISDHKGDTIAKQFENCLLDWGIEKVFTLTLDNASGNDRAISILKRKLMTKGADTLVLGGEFMHVRCCAHILNLIVNEGLGKMDDSVLSIRNAVKYARSSNSRLQAFQTRVDQEKIGRGSLVLDCTTRWNSTYLMLSTALKYRRAFERLAEEDKLYDAYFREEEGLSGNKKVGPPSSGDWENAEVMVKFLKIFYDATLGFSASKTVTSSGCYNAICKIESLLTPMAMGAESTLSNMAYVMKDKFNKYWESLDRINKILIVATVLDPRRKMHFATHCFEKLYGKLNPKCGEMTEGVKDLMRSLFKTYSTFQKNTMTVEDADESRANESSNLFDDCGRDEDDPFGEFSKMVAGQGVNEEISSELEMYLMEKVVIHQNQLGFPFDILSWWKNNSPKFPILSLIARDVLAIPVSSVASESAFSTGGRILDQYRSSLNPDTVEALVLSQDWLRSSLQYKAVVRLEQTEELQKEEEKAFLETLGQGLQDQQDVA